MEGAVEEGDDEEEEMFEREGGDGETSRTKLERAVEWLREELDIDHEGGGNVAEASAMQSIPVFMGHGTEDEKVPVELGRAAADFVKSLDVNVEWKEYEGQGHWYSADMLRDVVRFLKSLKRWEDTGDEVS